MHAPGTFFLIFLFGRLSSALVCFSFFFHLHIPLIFVLVSFPALRLYIFVSLSCFLSVVVVTTNHWQFTSSLPSEYATR